MAKGDSARDEARGKGDAEGGPGAELERRSLLAEPAVASGAGGVPAASPPLPGPHRGCLAAPALFRLLGVLPEALRGQSAEEPRSGRRTGLSGAGAGGAAGSGEARSDEEGSGETSSGCT